MIASAVALLALGGAYLAFSARAPANDKPAEASTATRTARTDLQAAAVTEDREDAPALARTRRVVRPVSEVKVVQEPSVLVPERQPFENNWEYENRLEHRAMVERGLSLIDRDKRQFVIQTLSDAQETMAALEIARRETLGEVREPGEKSSRHYMNGREIPAEAERRIRAELSTDDYIAFRTAIEAGWMSILRANVFDTPTHMP